MNVRELKANVPQEVVELVARLRAAGHESYVVGGAVRDLVLGLAPTEFDLATAATPRQVMELFPRTVAVGAAFGVVLVRSDVRSVEVASFRRESDYADGRHPTRVEAATMLEDAQRRDFRINSLYFDPLSHRLLDPCEGLADLRLRQVCAIGDPARRFGEDHLRLLRCIRFAAQLDYSIEAKTWEAIAPLAGQLRRISAERQRDELLKLLSGPRPGLGLRMLYYCGLLEVVLPEVAAMVGVAQPPQYHPEGDVFVHTCLVLDALRERSPTLALAALLHDVGKPSTFRVAERIRFDGHVEVGAKMAREMLERLRLDHASIETVVELVRHHLRFADAPAMRPATLKRFLRLPNFAQQLELHRADCMGSHGDLSLYDFCCSRLESLAAEDLLPARLLTGADLTRLGYRPGPLFRVILDALETEQLEGRIGDAEQAEAYVRRTWPLAPN
jgi:poly(A) polymerase